MTELPEEIKELADKCLDKHVQVVQAILSGDFSSNAKAYMHYYPDSDPDSAKASCARLLAIDNVSALYNALRDHSFAQNALSRAEAVAILSNMARHSVADLFVSNGHSLVLDQDKITPEALAAVSEVADTKEGQKIKMHDAKAAIKQLADMGGWNAAQDVNVNHSNLAVSIYLPDNNRDTDDG